MPEARARLCLDVDDARLVHKEHTLLTLPHRTTLSVQARLRHTLLPASLSIRSTGRYGPVGRPGGHQPGIEPSALVRNQRKPLGWIIAGRLRRRLIGTTLILQALLITAGYVAPQASADAGVAALHEVSAAAPVGSSGTIAG